MAIARDLETRESAARPTGLFRAGLRTPRPEAVNDRFCSPVPARVLTDFEARSTARSAWFSVSAT